MNDKIKTQVSRKLPLCTVLTIIRTHRSTSKWNPKQLPKNQWIPKRNDTSKATAVWTCIVAPPITPKKTHTVGDLSWIGLTLMGQTHRKAQKDQGAKAGERRYKLINLQSKMLIIAFLHKNDILVCRNSKLSVATWSSSAMGWSAGPTHTRRTCSRSTSKNPTGNSTSSLKEQKEEEETAKKP